MGTSALPDKYTKSPRAAGPRAEGIHIRQSTSAHVITKMFITRNEVTFLYVLLECFKWISTYFKANNAINPYNIDSL